MDSSVSPKDENWFLRVYRHTSNAVYDGGGADHPPSCTADAKNEWSYTVTPPYVLKPHSLINHIDNLTFIY